MLAKAVPEVPAQPADGDPEWSYEPKWDGFRAVVFRDGDEVVLSSRGGKDLVRYFPELTAAVRAELPARCVVDGEIVARRIVQVSLVFDHRVCDGGYAAGFLRRVIELIEHPLRAYGQI